MQSVATSVHGAWECCHATHSNGNLVTKRLYMYPAMISAADIARFLNEGLHGRDNSNLLQAIEDYMYDINEGKYQQKLYDLGKHQTLSITWCIIENRTILLIIDYTSDDNDDILEDDDNQEEQPLEEQQLLEVEQLHEEQPLEEDLPQASVIATATTATAATEESVIDARERVEFEEFVRKGCCEGKCHLQFDEGYLRSGRWLNYQKRS